MRPYAIYARKSTESEDRQVLSIPAQMTELRDLASRRGITLVPRVFEESFSAKAPGRPVFAELMREVAKKRLAGVVCWKLDRLARNPVDGAALIWALSTGDLREIVAPNRIYTGSGDDKLMMQIEFGMASKFIDDLSENVKRGHRALKAQGKTVGRPPIGWIKVRPATEHVPGRGCGDTVPDPERFALVRSLWERLLTGAHSVPEIRAHADQIGLRTRGSRRWPGQPLSLTQVCKMFSNPYYMGVVVHGGEAYPGAHEPMVTKVEYDRAQEILGHVDPRRPHKHRFTYTGLLRCGACERMITAEAHTNRHGSRYIYYRCTRKKVGYEKCPSPYVEERDVERQALAFMRRLRVSDKFVAWAFHYLDTWAMEEKGTVAAKQATLDRDLAAVEREIARLTRLTLQDRLTDDEYVTERVRLLAERERLRTALAAPEASAWLEPCKEVFSLVNQAETRFAAGDADEKRYLLATLGSNPRLQDGQLLIEAQKPFAPFLDRPATASLCG